MITILIAIAVLVLVLWYALSGRAWLKSRPWARPFFAWIEPIEIALFKKSETILFARTKMLIGVVLTVLTQLGSIDLTPIMPLVPDKYATLIHTVLNLLPMLITVMGFIDEHLRNATTKPIELVAIPDRVVADNPAIARTLDVAAEAKDQAVHQALAAVADTKAV